MRSVNRVHAGAALSEVRSTATPATLLGCLGLLITFGLSGCDGAPAADEIHGEEHDTNTVVASAEAQANIGMETASPRRMKLQHTVRATGIISPDQTRYAHVTPLGRGLIEQVHVNLGDRVEQGAALLSYDNIELGELIGEFLSMKAGLVRLEADRDKDEKILDRARSLLEVEAIATQQYEITEAEYKTSVASVGSQRAEISRVEEKLHRFGLTDDDISEIESAPHETRHRTASHDILPAPFGGVIVEYDVSPGEIVDRDEALFTLVDTSKVWVLADVYQKDIGLLQTGGECEVEVSSYPNEIFRGEVTYVSDVLDPASRTAKVRCVTPNIAGRLKLQMFVDVRIPSRDERDVLAVPVPALQSARGDTIVFVKVDEDRFDSRVVRIGDQVEGWAEVLVGLEPGEVVVTIGSFYLKSILLREQIGDEH